MDKVRLAIFGMNQGARIGRRAVLNPACDLVAVAGFGQQAEDAAVEFGAPLFADYNDLLAQVPVDAVAIALPNQLHLPATRACLDAGVKYLLLEKPIAAAPEDGQAIIDMCNEAGATLLIGHHRRSANLFLALKDFLASGRLGDIVSVQSYYAICKNPGYWDDEWRQVPSGGPLLVNAIHDIDDLNNVLDMTPTRVYAAKRNTIRGNQSEDSCSALIEFAEGPTATYFLSDGTPSPWNYDLLAHADERMCWEDGQDSMHIFGTKGSIGFPSMTFYTYPDEEHWGWFKPLMHEQFEVELNDPMQSEVDHFFDLCLGRETVPRCTGEQGLKTLKMVNAIIESSNTHQVVEIA